jgi:hypothetical protein
MGDRVDTDRRLADLERLYVDLYRRADTADSRADRLARELVDERDRRRGAARMIREAFATLADTLEAFEDSTPAAVLEGLAVFGGALRAVARFYDGALTDDAYAAAELGP